MKKIIFVVSLVLVLLLSSCGRLPSGHADSISYDFGTSKKTLTDVEFEYVNENTIKITDIDGEIIYIDSSHLINIVIGE